MIDFPLNLRDSDEDHAWRTASVWLSLDRFERFWPDVGLTLSNGGAVKAAVRDMLRVQYAIDEEWRATYAVDPEAANDIHDPTEERASTCFRRINEAAGAQDAECIARWLKGPVLGGIKEWNDHHHMWHNTWSSLLYHVGKQDPVEFELSYGIPRHTVRRIIEIAARYRSEADRINERVEAADQEPLSGWDAIAYADYRWECPEPSPLEGLGLHLKYICFDRAWAEIVRCTRPADIDALIEWGRAFHKAHGWPDDVAIPDDVRAAWHQVWLN